MVDAYTARRRAADRLEDRMSAVAGSGIYRSRVLKFRYLQRAPLEKIPWAFILHSRCGGTCHAMPQDPNPVEWRCVMPVLTEIVAALGISATVALVWYLVRSTRAWRRFHGQRLVTCPETGHIAAVRIDIPHAIAAGARSSDLRLCECSRWRTRGRCDEPCVHEAATPESAIDAVVKRWYAHTSCIYCGKPIEDQHGLDHHAALLNPEGRTREWSEVPPEQLIETFRTSAPVCWNCHVTEMFRLRYPALITDRTDVRR
jgi:hypothetical protein